MYSQRLKQLVAEPPNAGEVPGATHRASGENEICGDRVELTFKVVQGKVIASRFRAEGCPAAIACAAVATILCEGRSPDECLELSIEDLVEALDGLPAHKNHAASLALDVIRRAFAGAVA